MVCVEKIQAMQSSSPTKYTQTGLATKCIVSDSKPKSTIVLSKNHSLREQQAAEEIQRYIEISSGAKLIITADANRIKGHAIRIQVKQSDSRQSPEAFSIQVEDKQTKIIGNSPIGALYGAYEFLERVVGVRWYLPDPLGQVVPRKNTIKLPDINTRQSPSFPMRWVGDDLWMLHNKQNRCKDGFRISPGVFHTQNMLLPREKHDTGETEKWQKNMEAQTPIKQRQYFKEHPDFFALIDGKRSNKSNAKLCYSNSQVATEIAKNMALILDSDPNINLISFSPTDGHSWCQCKNCNAMDEKNVSSDRSKSRRSLIFYNRIASELRKRCPESQMMVGAYNVYTRLPKDKTVKADPMLNVIITHYQDYCMVHPVNDGNCPRNQKYVELIKEWEKHVGNKIFFYEYYWKMNWFGLPWPIVHCIKKDIPWYRDQGYKGLYTQYSKQNCWTLFPNYYIAARLLWDADADVDAIVSKMYEDLFGVAAEHMKSYYGLMEKQMAECKKHFPGSAIVSDPKADINALVIFTPKLRKQLRYYYEKALSVNKDETVALRLAKIGVSLEHVERLMHYAELRRAAVEQKDKTKAIAIAKEALAVGKALRNEIRDNRQKWDGVVAEETIRSEVFLGKSIRKWQAYVAEITD
jgi:hypothetical protein